MRRWNGWGDESISLPLPPAARAFLTEMIGDPVQAPSEDLPAIIQRVPPSRLPEHALLNRDPESRIRHARGQSLPDWIALRFGTVDTFPDAIAYPAGEDDIRHIIGLAVETDASLIPYGAGSSVLGHITPMQSDMPVITIDMSRMNRLEDLDERSLIACFGAGALGPHLEAQLKDHGYTLGHFPQSFEYSSLGGWIATRSSGQQSLYYGRIEDLFAGGRLLTPHDVLDMQPFPASAAGPDLRHLVLGSEGRLGIVTRAKMRISPLPECERFYAVFFPTWEQGYEAVRIMTQERIPLSMLRLSNARETKTTLVLAGHEKLIHFAESMLKLRGAGDEKCLLIMGTMGTRSLVAYSTRHALYVARSHGGVNTGSLMGRHWSKNRFRAPYFRNSVWEAGYTVDTLETAVDWTNLSGMMNEIISALERGLEDQGEHVLAFAHISHVYPTGASIYVTYLYRIANTAEETLERWKRLKKAASDVIVSHHATISHQHGIGIDHQPYLEKEKGALGMEVLMTTLKTFDPDGIMNPGKLIGSKHAS